MSRHVAPLHVHPPTLDGTAHDRATGTREAVVARRTGETLTRPAPLHHGDVTGAWDVFEVYAADVPYPRDWVVRGRVHVRFDALPAGAAISFHFTDPGAVS